ncbi:GNAT family N-acetyltransferase [Streptomyces sp. NPDC059009]|uniref:GNAT family N-acetyltransferase n=1 Tax=Streptomyces sp. NPDC059009 TaxID=3346694 RepID=UPI0036A963E9
MSETDGGIVIRDDRARGVLEALAPAQTQTQTRAHGDGPAGNEPQVVGQIVYFTLDTPAAALVPVHTEVLPAHEGQGIAGRLARELYATAAREGLDVVPLCPYVVKWAEKHPDEAPAAPPELLRAALDKVKSDPTAW